MTLMMSLVRHEVLSLLRDRIPRLLLAVFIGMVSVSSALGWLASSTVSSVWRETVRAGLTKAPNPFGSVSPLFFARNTVIYVVLIGALCAIVLGATSGLRDRKSRTIDLVLSRDVSSRELLAGKLLGVATVLAAVLLAAFVVAGGALWVVSSAALSTQDVIHLALFFALSGLLLTGFAALGILGGSRARGETTALLVPTSIWALLTFLLPQIATGANPVSLLNPVPAVPATDAAFIALHQWLGPLLITEQFKTAGGLLLANPDVSGSLAIAVATVSAASIVVVGILIVTPRKSLREALRD